MKNILLTFMAIGLLASCQNSNKGEQAAAAVTGAAKKAVQKVADSAPATNATTFKVLPGSTVAWSGKKIAGEHKGTIDISEGNLTVANNKVTGGKFTIDMSSILCTDLAAGKGKEDLEGHLKSPDFFNIGKFPTSTFEITSVAGNQITGNLTLLGVSKSVTFPANMDVITNGAKVNSPSFTINRTDWGLKYGSASFFDNLKDKAIDDQITLSINLKAS